MLHIADGSVCTRSTCAPCHCTQVYCPLLLCTITKLLSSALDQALACLEPTSLQCKDMQMVVFLP